MLSQFPVLHGVVQPQILAAQERKCIGRALAAGHGPAAPGVLLAQRARCTRKRSKSVLTEIVNFARVERPTGPTPNSLEALGVGPLATFTS